MGNTRMLGIYRAIRDAIGTTAAGVAGLWGDLPTVVHLLVLLMVADIACGYLRAIAERRLSEDVSFRGLTRKVVILMVVGVGFYLQAHAAPGVPLAEIIAGFYISREGLSFLRHVSQMGVPVPAVLAEALEAMDKSKDKQKDVADANH